jgi:hypothetical protein
MPHFSYLWTYDLYGPLRNAFDAENPLRWQGEGVDPEIEAFWALLVAISGPKKSRFQGPPLPMALVIDIARIKICTYIYI